MLHREQLSRISLLAAEGARQVPEPAHPRHPGCAPCCAKTKATTHIPTRQPQPVPPGGVLHLLNAHSKQGMLRCKCAVLLCQQQRLLKIRLAAVKPTGSPCSERRPKPASSTHDAEQWRRPNTSHTVDNKYINRIAATGMAAPVQGLGFLGNIVCVAALLQPPLVPSPQVKGPTAKGRCNASKGFKSCAAYTDQALPALATQEEDTARHSTTTQGRLNYAHAYCIHRHQNPAHTQHRCTSSASSHSTERAQRNAAHNTAHVQGKDSCSMPGRITFIRPYDSNCTLSCSHAAAPDDVPHIQNSIRQPAAAATAARPTCCVPTLATDSQAIQKSSESNRRANELPD